MKRYEPFSRANQRLVDALIAGAAFYLAYQIRFAWEIPPASRYQMWLLLGPVMAGQVLIGSLTGVYCLIWRYVGLADALRIARSQGLFSGILFVFSLVLPGGWGIDRLPLSVVLIQVLLSVSATLGVRVLRRCLYEAGPYKTSEKKMAKPILLVGAGRAGAAVAKEIASQRDFRAIGFVDDDSGKIGAVISGLRVLGPLNALPSIVEHHGVEEVIVCIPKVARGTLKRLWALCGPLPVHMKIVPTVEEVLQGNTNIARFRDVDIEDLLGRKPVELPLDDPDVIAAYHGKRILITGAGGSIGSELADQIVVLSPAQLILLDKDENGLNDTRLRIRTEYDEPTVYPVIADVRSSERLRSVFERFRPEVVFHAAAHKHVHLMELNPCEAILNNVIGTKNLVECSLTFGVGRFVLISTDKAVKPTCIMGASKRLSEMILRARRDPEGKTRFSCVRFGNVVGSRGSVVPIFKNQIARGGPVTVTHPDAERFMMTIPEAVRLLIQAGTLGTAGEIYVLEMGDPVRIWDLAEDLIELSGLRPERDIEIKITQLRSGEKIREELVDETLEKLLPTRFEKINLVETHPFDVAAFEGKLKAVEDAARQESPELLRILQQFDIGFRPSKSPAAPRFRPGYARIRADNRTSAATAAPAPGS